MIETLSARDGDRFGDRWEAKWTQLKTTQTALQSQKPPQKHPICRVVVPAVTEPCALSAELLDDCLGGHLLLPSGHAPGSRVAPYGRRSPRVSHVQNASVRAAAQVP